MLSLRLVGRFSSSMRSPLPGVSEAAWRHFVIAMETQSSESVSASGGLGSYDMRPRRLIEIGYAENLRRLSRRNRRQVQVCDLVAPWTVDRFLADPVIQLSVLGDSMADYQEELRRGKIQKPAEMSLAGALAVLHRGGRGALKSWPKLFHNTRALYLSAQQSF